MSQPSHEAIRRRFERDAQGFDAIYRLERSLLTRWFNTTFRKAIFERYNITFEQAGDLSGKAVLDIGCGPGIYSVDLAQRGARRVVGIDLSANMVGLAEREADRFGMENVCEFRVGDFYYIDLCEKFDITLAIGVFDYLPDPVSFLRKMVSVTTGKVIASFPGHSFLRKPARELRYRLLGKGNVYFYSEADVRRLVEQAGLRDSRIIPIRSSGSGFLLLGGS